MKIGKIWLQALLFLVASPRVISRLTSLAKGGILWILSGLAAVECAHACSSLTGEFSDVVVPFFFVFLKIDEHAEAKRARGARERERLFSLFPSTTPLR